jgi:hypothetical protein
VSVAGKLPRSPGELYDLATSAAGFFTLPLGIGLHFGGDALDGDRLFPWFLLVIARLWGR